MGKTQKKLGEKIKILRLDKGLTQEKLAEKVKVDFTTINKIENAKRNPSLRTMEKIARALDVPLKDLL